MLTPTDIALLFCLGVIIKGMDTVPTWAANIIWAASVLYVLCMLIWMTLSG